MRNCSRGVERCLCWNAPTFVWLKRDTPQRIINGFLHGGLSCDLKKTYTDIRNAILTHIDFSDNRTYDFVTCWIIGTYFFPVFSHYPYVHFTGPKGSGKSQCLHVLSTLCHNAKIAGSMTLAVQFRIIGALQPALCSMKWKIWDRLNIRNCTGC